MKTRRVWYLSLLLLLLTESLLAACQPIQPGADQAVHVHNHATDHQASDATSNAAATAAGVAPLLGNLGDHKHPISTHSELAQKYFDEGLILTFGFNHAEAIRSYNDAIKLDPNCAICYWGIAYALGPNINAPVMDPTAIQPAWDALQMAIELAPQASTEEQAYIKALTARYSDDPKADHAPLDRAYADAMREMSHAYPDDLDAAALFAEAMMDVTAWNYWTKDGKPTEYTDEIISTLEGVLKRDPNNPAANHFYIHVVESSPDPDRAVPSADRLTHLVPGAGHLVHMPGHIYWRVGRYQDVVVSNEHAIHSDETYIPDRGAQGLYVIGYYPHNIHFLSCAAQMLGESKLAIESARKVAEKIPTEVAVAVPLLQNFGAIPYFALVRFGKWDEILAEPQPDERLQYATGIWHWARGMALVNSGKAEQAQAEYELVSKLADTDEMKNLAILGFSTGANNLHLAGNILAADLAGAKGDTAKQIAELESAVQAEDALPYVEPPVWYIPTRDLLGAALLKAGRAADAEAVYRQDLKQYRNSGWAFFGLMQSLEAQNKTTDAAAVKKEFETAWQYADVTLTASRF